MTNTADKIVVASDQQVAIFQAFADPDSRSFIVEARAGTGKTWTCMEGIRRAPEKRRCYVVFNKKNQEEAAGKIRDPGVDVLTYNSLGYRILRQNWQGIRPDDSVESDRVDAVVAGDAEFRHITSKYHPYGAINKIVSWFKNTVPQRPTSALVAEVVEIVGVDMEDGGHLAQKGWTEDLVALAALRALEASLVPNDGDRCSFVDQLWIPVVLGWARPRYDLMVVDEAQDSNAVQLDLARRVCKGRIVLIGDGRQAIYAWRGADADGMARFQKERGASVYPLTITRRCPRAVVALAKTLVPDYEAAEEAPEGVVRKLDTLDAMEGELVPGDAVVSRLNAPLAGICLRLLRRGTPAYIEGRDVARDILALVKEFQRASTIEEMLARVDKWEERKTARLGDKEWDKRKVQQIADQAETIRVFAEVCRRPDEVYGKIEAVFKDSAGERRPAVVLSSTHKAKGLEWQRVFVLMATYAVQRGPAPACEASNLTYTAWTRAKNELILVDANLRTIKRSLPLPDGDSQK